MRVTSLTARIIVGISSLCNAVASIPLSQSDSAAAPVPWLFLRNRRQTVDLRREFLLRAARPDDLHAVQFGSLAQAEGNWQFRLGQIASRGHYLARQTVAADAHFHPCPDRVSVAFSAD